MHNVNGSKNYTSEGRTEMFSATSTISKTKELPSSTSSWILKTGDSKKTCMKQSGKC